MGAHFKKWFLSLFSIFLYNLCPCAVVLLPLLFPPVFIWLTNPFCLCESFLQTSNSVCFSFFNSRCHLLSLPPGTRCPVCVPFNTMQSHITPLVLWLLRSALLYHHSSGTLFPPIFPSPLVYCGVYENLCLFSSYTRKSQEIKVSAKWVKCINGAQQKRKQIQ